MQEKFQEHSIKLSEHEQQISNMKESVDRIDSLVRQHDNDISVLKSMLSNTATKSDIEGVHSKIESSIAGLLKDAINAMPAKQSLILTIILVLIAVANLVHSLHG